MKKRILFVECVSPKGHISFNKSFLKFLEHRILKIMIGKSISGDFNNNVNVEEFDDSYVSRNRLAHFVGCLKITIKALIDATTNNRASVVFFSYDILTLPVISLLSKLLNIEVYLFEHNTVPTNKIQKIIHKFAKSCKRICFTPYAHELYKTMGNQSVLISLPVEFSKINNGIENSLKVLCPSANSNYQKIIEYSLRNSNFEFFVKSDIELGHPNITSYKFLNDYFESISTSCAIYVPLKHEHRMSGPVIDALSLGKPVVISKSTLGDFLVKKYRGYIYYDDKNIDFILTDFCNSKNKIELENINNEIKLALNEFI